MNASASVAAAPRPALGKRMVSVGRDYAALTKPGITFLVLVTTLVGYIAGTPDVAAIDPLRLFHTILGSLAVVAGASALNQVIERDADALMRRTRQRPLPTGRISVPSALAFGLILSAFGVIWLGAMAGALPFLVAAISWVLYALVYTPMKRLTTAATIVGAIPGALPPVIGWTAATDDLSYGGWVLFAILFLWQFPHFLALGWMYREDYQRGGMPTLAHSDPSGAMSRRQAIIYAMALLPVSLMPALAGMAGPVYFVAALILGAGYIIKAFQCQEDDMDRRMRGLFLYSIVYLPTLLGVLVAERLAMALLS